MVAGRGADQLEERPEWLPAGWTICTKARKNGKMDRYYVSPSGQILRSKAEVLRCKNKRKAVSIDHESAAQSARHIDSKRQSESKNSEVLHLQEDAPISLPDGWIVETKIRKGGKSSGASYKIYINPETGHKCYSMKEVNRYVTGGELSAPTSRAKNKATLNSPDSVLLENEGFSMKPHSGLKNDSKTKKNQIPTVAAAHNQISARRSSSRSSMLKVSGIDSSQDTPVVHKASEKVWAGKTKYENQPYFQDAFPEHSQEEAVDISESIDKIIRNLSQDLKIPDISIAFSTHMDGEFDLVVEQSTKQLGGGCSESTTCEKKKVETNSVTLPHKKSRKRTDWHSAAVNEDKPNGKPDSGPIEVVNETSVDMLPAQTKEVSNGNLPLPENGKSDRDKRSSKRKASRGKQSEPDDVHPSPPENKDAKLEDDTRRSDETVTKSTRTKGHKKDNKKTPTCSLSSRVSPRLAGLDAGNADINENDLRRNKRSRI